MKQYSINPIGLRYLLFILFQKCPYYSAGFNVTSPVVHTNFRTVPDKCKKEHYIGKSVTYQGRNQK